MEEGGKLDDTRKQYNRRLFHLDAGKETGPCGRSFTVAVGLSRGFQLVVGAVRAPHAAEWHSSHGGCLPGCRADPARYSPPALPCSQPGRVAGPVARRGFLLLLAFMFWTLYGFRHFYLWLGLFIFSFFLLPELPADLKMGISLPLQLMSTQITTAMAGLFIPITAAGNIFYIEGHAFEVTVACSGLNTWIGFLFAGLLWMLFERFSIKSLVAVLLGAPMLALLTNTLRLFITALVASNVSADAGLAIHTNLEYVLFPAGLVLMWVMARRLHAQHA